MTVPSVIVDDLDLLLADVGIKEARGAGIGERPDHDPASAQADTAAV
jgi:hypothetical protein